MKKLLAIVLTVAMLLSVGVYVVSAEAFVEPVGTVNIDWDPEAGSKVTIDGDMADWEAAGYTLNEITQANLVHFDHVAGSTVPEEFKISTYFVSDADWLYVGFYIVDPDVRAANSDSIHLYSSGDCFQLGIDFDSIMEQTLIEDPGYFEMIGADSENIFYSFAYVEDDKDLNFACQNVADAITVEERNATNHDGVKGKARRTAEGWCAEFALSWEMIYEDCIYKLFTDEHVVELTPDNPLTLGMSMCYLNADSTGPVKGAVGTFKSTDCKTNENPGEGGGKGVDPTDNGMYLTLNWEEGIHINCDGIVASNGGEETETDEEETTGEVLNSGKFESVDKLFGFNEKQKTYFSTGNSEITFREDGSLLITASEWATEDAAGNPSYDVVAHVGVSFSRLLMSGLEFPAGTTQAQKLEMLPNGGDMNYGVMVLKVKRSESVQDQDVYITYGMGKGGSTPNMGNICFAEENVTSDDGYEYLIFDLTERDDFKSDWINSMNIFWVDDEITEERQNGSMELFEIALFDSVEDAKAEYNLEIVQETEPEKKTETEPEVSETEPEESKTAAESKTEAETEAEGGCASVVGFSAAAMILSAAAAAVVLKKKED